MTSKVLGKTSCCYFPSTLPLKTATFAFKKMVCRHVFQVLPTKSQFLFAVAPPSGNKKGAYTADRRHDGHQSAQGHRETAHVVEKSLAAGSVSKAGVD